MGEDGESQRFHVVGDAVIPPLHEGLGLGSPHEKEGPPRADAQTEGFNIPGGRDDGHDVVEDLLCYSYLVRHLLHRDHLLTREHVLEPLDLFFYPGVGEDLLFLGQRGIAHVGPHQEAVQLRFRQGIGALILQGVLGGDDHEGLGQGVGLAVHRDLKLVHRLEQGALGLGGGAVDLVHQADVGENRPGLEFKGAGMGVVHGDPQDIGGEEVARELDALKRGMDGHGQALGQERLAHARGILDQEVPPREQGDDGEGDGLGLALDHEAYILMQVGELLADLIQFLFFFLNAGNSHGALFIL